MKKKQYLKNANLVAGLKKSYQHWGLTAFGEFLLVRQEKVKRVTNSLLGFWLG